MVFVIKPEHKNNTGIQHNVGDTLSKPDDLLATRRRKQIISAASLCFSQTGFHSTSMADIIEECGLSAGQIYRHYSGKEIIVNESIRYITELWCAFLLNKLPEETKTDDIIDINSAFWDKWPEDQRRLLIETYSEASRNDTVRQIVNRAEQKLFAGLDEKFSISMPEISQQARHQKILLLILLTDGVICRRFTDNSLNINEIKRINNIFSHQLHARTNDCQSD